MKLQDIKGIGKRKETILNTLGIYTVNDLLYHFPTRFEDRRKALEAKNGSVGSFCGRLISKEHWRSRQGTQSLRLHIAWEGYVVEVLFFNALYLDRAFVLDRDYCFYGKLEQRGIFFNMVHPAFSQADQDDFFEITPLYTYRKGLGQKDLANFVSYALDEEAIEDYLDIEDRLEWKLMELGEAIRQMHFPSSRESYAQAKYRLIFDEFFNFLLENQAKPRPKTREFPRKDRESFLELVDFSLTQDQLKVLEELDRDLASGLQMQRLIQGDVGSGKSLLAYYSLWKLLDTGAQGVYLAPTELLARQQEEIIAKMFPGKSLLLVGSSKNKEKIYQDIAENKYPIIVGTHALFEEDVNFADLRLVVADEQQRFGVAQRSALYDKGQNPHILMMSATPIPRTLSMILHRNLDISYLREKPPGRRKIKTKVIGPGDLGAVYEHIEGEIAKGRSAFVVFPLIEESEHLDIISLDEGIEELTKIFGDRLGYVHGRMNDREKEEALHDFRQGKKSVLASTTVIEVGIDIPQASILLLRGAERFGLSQIHQIRGRIGRNKYDSYCYLCAEKSIPERLYILEKYDDGFAIADEDLRLRGPGELRGIKQSGDLNFRLADPSRHQKILQRVSKLLEGDILIKYSRAREALEL